jgi:hypothetical protein
MAEAGDTLLLRPVLTQQVGDEGARAVELEPSIQNGGTECQRGVQ